MHLKLETQWHFSDELKMEVIWENPDVTSNYTSGTIPFSSEYKFIEIKWRTVTASPWVSSVMFDAHETFTNVDILVMGTAESGRTFSVSNNVITVNSGSYNNYAIPVAVIGYK